MTEVKSERCCLWSWNSELYEMTVKQQKEVFFCLTVSPLWDEKGFQEEEALQHWALRLCVPMSRWAAWSHFFFEQSRYHGENHLHSLPSRLSGSGSYSLPCQETKDLRNRCLGAPSAEALPEAGSWEGLGRKYRANGWGLEASSLLRRFMGLWGVE